VKPTLYTVNRPGPGRLSTMARPRGGDWLLDELRALRRAGIDVLVCALTHPELVELELTQEPAACATAGLEFMAVPIPDRGLPDDRALQPVLDHLHAALTAGRHVVTHCRAGIGRASLLAGALLVRDGLNPEQAWEQVAAARGLPVPDTDEQRQWLTRVANQ
jgi:protein-tyrosine phosphatase